MSDDTSKPAAPPAPTPPKSAHDALDQWLSQTINCTVRGALSCLYNVPPQLTLERASYVMGRIVGVMYRGPDGAVMAFRKQCKDAFRQGLRDSEIQPMPAAERASAQGPQAPDGQVMQ